MSFGNSNASKLELAELELRKAQNQVKDLKRVQKAVLRRIHLLPNAIGELIDGEVLDRGILADDGLSMSYPIGAIQVSIQPFDELLTLSDPAGNNTDLTIEFGTEKDFDRDMVLRILGFAELAKRSKPGETGTDWVNKLNSETVAV